MKSTSTRAYIVINETTGASERFTNKAKARKAYKAMERAGVYATAQTYREHDGGRERLDRSGTPEWAL